MSHKKMSVKIPYSDLVLEGDLIIPSDPKGLVLFVHGSGSSRFSPRNRFVASLLNKAGFATLLFDLLTAEEEAIDIYTRDYRFNIELLAKRLEGTTDWVVQQPQTKGLALGYFGASTGAAAALIASARVSHSIAAIVSRGGRADLAGSYLTQIKSPTLLIVGGDDGIVIEMNEKALALMPCQKQLLIIDGASHLFEEPGKLEEVSKAAVTWFKKHLPQVEGEAG